MKKTKYLAQGAVIAGAYAALCLALMPIAFGPFQLRVAEALTVLPFFFPAAVPGLFVGCIIANLFSPYGIIDIVFGSGATLIAAFLTYWCGRHIRNEKLSIWLAPLPPVVVNALIIGGVITYTSGLAGDTTPFYIFAGQLFAEEFLVCYLLGIPLLYAIKTRMKKLKGQKDRL